MKMMCVASVLLLLLLGTMMTSVNAGVDCGANQRCAPPPPTCDKPVTLDYNTVDPQYNITIESTDKYCKCQVDGTAQLAMSNSSDRYRVYCRKQTTHVVKLTVLDSEERCVLWKILSVKMKATNVKDISIRIDQQDVGSPYAGNPMENVWLTQLQMDINQVGRGLALYLTTKSNSLCVYDLEMSLCCQQIATTTPTTTPTTTRTTTRTTTPTTTSTTTTTPTTTTTTPTTTTTTPTTTTTTPTTTTTTPTTTTTTPTTTVTMPQNRDCVVANNETVTDVDLKFHNRQCGFDWTVTPEVEVFKSKCLGVCSATHEFGRLNVSDSKSPPTNGVDSVCQCCKALTGQWLNYPLRCWLPDNEEADFVPATLFLYQITQCDCRDCTPPKIGAAAPHTIVVRPQQLDSKDDTKDNSLAGGDNTEAGWF